MTSSENLLEDGQNRKGYNTRKDSIVCYEGPKKLAITTAPRKMEEEDAGTAMETGDTPIVALHIHEIWGNDDESMPSRGLSE